MELIIAGILTSFFLSLLVPRLKSNALIDRPNERSSHKIPKPTAGGIIFVLVSTTFITLKGYYVPLICLPLALVGFLDDLFFLNAGLRYFIQVLTAISLIKISPLVQNFESIPIIAMIFLYIVLILIITGIINFCNFMDGLDGLLTGCMIIIFALICFSSNPELIPLVGSLLGFLAWNWSPSKIFMGDVGSTFLGAVFCGIIFQSSTFEYTFAYLLIASPLLFDSSICVIRRYFAKQNIFEPHCLHLFQRLHQSGWSHSKVSILYITATTFLGVNYSLFGLQTLIILSILTLLVGFIIDKKFAIPFSIVN